MLHQNIWYILNTTAYHLGQYYCSYVYLIASQLCHNHFHPSVSVFHHHGTNSQPYIGTVNNYSSDKSICSKSICIQMFTIYIPTNRLYLATYYHHQSKQTEKHSLSLYPVWAIQPTIVYMRNKYSKSCMISRTWVYLLSYKQIDLKLWLTSKYKTNCRFNG